MQEGQADFSPNGYYAYYYSAQKKGYSGTAVFCKKEPLQVSRGVDGLHLDEGRVLTLEFADYYLVNCYAPNAQRDLARLPYRMQFENDFRAYLQRLSAQKPLILCGDLNVAHAEIDLKNPKSNVGNAGFTNEERGKFSELLAAGFTDSFRYLYPEREGAYSWWSYMNKSRERNAGWRIDYFVVSERIAPQINEALIYPQVQGSDHCPVGLEIRLNENAKQQ